MKKLKILLLSIVISCISVTNVNAIETNVSGYLSTNGNVYTLNVPYYNQYEAGAPMGCEAASLLQALHYKKCALEYNLKSFLKVMPYSKNDNPYEGYSGTPYQYLPYPTYQSIFPEPLTKWANQYGTADNISGCEVSVLQKEIKKSNPVIVYISYNFETPEWNKYPWGTGMDNMHVVTLCGYDENNDKYQVCDPVKGKYWVKGSMFEKSYNYLKWAVSIKSEDTCVKYGHKYSEFTEITPVTDKQNGLKVKKCVVCHKEVKAIIPRKCQYSDVIGDKWYFDTVVEVSQLGLMTGATETLFKPDTKMNRAMAVCVLHRMEGSMKTEYKSLFKDVANGHYYSSAITWAKQKDVINGYNDGTFKPTKNVTREEMVTMLYNFARYKGINVKSNKDISHFNDYSKITPYARVPMKWAVEKGLLSGKDNGTRLDPRGTATRAECAKMNIQAYKVIYK